MSMIFKEAVSVLASKALGSVLNKVKHCGFHIYTQLYNFCVCPVSGYVSGVSMSFPWASCNAVHHGVIQSISSVFFARPATVSDQRLAKKKFNFGTKDGQVNRIPYVWFCFAFTRADCEQFCDAIGLKFVILKL